MPYFYKLKMAYFDVGEETCIITKWWCMQIFLIHKCYHKKMRVHNLEFFPQFFHSFLCLHHIILKNELHIIMVYIISRAHPFQYNYHKKTTSLDTYSTSSNTCFTSLDTYSTSSNTYSTSSNTCSTSSNTCSTSLNYWMISFTY